MLQGSRDRTKCNRARLVVDWMNQGPPKKVIARARLFRLGVTGRECGSRGWSIGWVQQVTRHLAYFPSSDRELDKTRQEQQEEELRSRQESVKEESKER